MKKALSLLLFILVCNLSAKAQLVIDSKYTPLSFETILLAAQAQAIKDQENKDYFNEMQEKAYEYYNKGDYRGFIYYSDRALSAGWHTSKLYYDRGKAYEILHNNKAARKEYKKALKNGYYLAQYALDNCKKNK